MLLWNHALKQNKKSKNSLTKESESFTYRMDDSAEESATVWCRDETLVFEQPSFRHNVAQALPTFGRYLSARGLVPCTQLIPSTRVIVRLLGACGKARKDYAPEKERSVALERQFGSQAPAPNSYTSSGGWCAFDQYGLSLGLSCRIPSDMRQ